MTFDKIAKPASSLAKSKLARELYEQFQDVRDARDKAIWIEARNLYYIDTFGLHNYLFGKDMTKTAFYAEIDVPGATAAFKIALYDFYVIKHGFTFDELSRANTKKLHRAIPFVREAEPEKIKEIVELAEREKQSLSDFLISCGAKDQFCVHEDKEEITDKKVVCKHCHKELKQWKKKQT